MTSWALGCLTSIHVSVSNSKSSLTTKLGRIVRSRRPEVFCKTGVTSATLLKKRLWHRCFPVNFAKFLRAPFLTKHLRWLLLDCRLAYHYISQQLMMKPPPEISNKSQYLDHMIQRSRSFVVIATCAQKSKVPGPSPAASCVQRWALCNNHRLISKCLRKGWKW